MKIVVSGAKGLLGHEAVRVCDSYGDEVIRTDITPDLRHLDITDFDEIMDLLQSEKPDWLINCAAYTDVDGCEDNEMLAYRMNAKAPGYLADACRQCSVNLLHISTDYVFDGKKKQPYTEDDTTGPINLYGKSKLAGEKAVKTSMKDFIIVRPQWLFGPGGKNFVSTILDIARGTDRIKVVNDQWGSPTYSKDLAKALRILIAADARGIYHVCNRGRTTWFELASKAVEFVECSLLGVDRVLAFRVCGALTYPCVPQLCKLFLFEWDEQCVFIILYTILFFILYTSPPWR